MKGPQTNHELGTYYKRRDGIWRMIGICQHPTVVLVNVATGEKEHLVPNCLNAQAYTRLLEEGKDA